MDPECKCQDSQCSSWYSNSGPLTGTHITLVSKHFFSPLPVKILGNSYSFDTADSEHDNQIALSPTDV
jgi:hypothetical protein